MVDLGPVRPGPDDPIRYLTDVDKQWLAAHGWHDPTAPSPLASKLLDSGAAISMANIEAQRATLFPLFSLTLPST